MKISKVFHSNGLLLCVVDNKRFVVWNPYLGQTRWIRRPKKVSGQYDLFAFGYNNNRNHKILRMLRDCNKGGGEDLPDIFELYDFNSNLWRVLDVKQELYIETVQFPVSLKGNTYFVAEDIISEVDFLLCFDFTTERFGPRLPLPYNSLAEMVTLSCVREEQLAVLWKNGKTMEFWITTKILPNALSWSKFLKVKMTPLNGFKRRIYTDSFFIDEEKKVVVAFDDCFEQKPITKPRCYGGAHIIGEDGYFKIYEARKN